MTAWIAGASVLLMAIVLMHAASLLWPKRAGSLYLRRNLSTRGIPVGQIPPACIGSFVDDAHQYARAVCAGASGSHGTPGRVPHFEFERMLRVHAFVIHALLTGRTSAAECAADDEPLIQEHIRSEMLRAGLDPYRDAAELQRFETEVRTGKSWLRQRALLDRYQLSAFPLPDAAGELAE